MKQPNITIYGSRSCSDTTRTTGLLDRRGIPYEFRDVDQSPEFNDYIAGLNDGKRVIPTLRLDNRTLVNPSEDELTEALDESTEAR